MDWLEAIEERVALPGDDETLRSRKRLVVLAALAGSLTTLLNAAPMLAAGLTPMGSTYLVSSFNLLLGGLVLLVWPVTYTAVTFLLLVDVLLSAAVTQALSGGLASGFLSLPWTIFAPLGAVLSLGRRAVVLILILFAAVVIGVAVLDPILRAGAPHIDASVVLWFNIQSLLSLGLFVMLTSLYLLAQIDHYREQADSLLHNILPRSISRAG